MDHLSLLFSDELLATLVPAVAFWVFSGLYELLVYLLPNSRLHSREDEKEKNIISRWTVARGVLFHQALQIFLVTIFLKVTGNDRGTPKPQPSFFLGAWQMIKAMVIFDAWEYASHRTLHTSKFLYKNFHAIHHRIVVPYSFGSLYCHPIDGLLTDTIGGIVVYICALLHLEQYEWTRSVIR